MTTKSDLTPEAWEQLKVAPFAAAMYVITASPSPLGMFSEMGALTKGMQAAAGQVPAGTLMGDLMAELDPKEQQRLMGEIKPKFGTSQPDTMAQLLTHVTAAGAALATLPADDAASYRGFALGLARTVAEAAKDDGVAVGPREVAALAELEQALGGA
jgi:hypothetical protein